MPQGTKNCSQQNNPAVQRLAVRGKRAVFLSLPQYEFQVPTGLAEPGSKHWRVVEMPLHAPWFLLTVEDPFPDGEGLRMSYTLCIAWELDLAEALKAMEVKRVRGLVAMMPGWASANGQWSSRQIAEVWLHADENGRFVTLLDDTGKAFDGGTCGEAPKSRTFSELLLRLPAGRRQPAASTP